MNYPKYYKSAAHNIKVISKIHSVWVTSKRIESEDYDLLRHIQDLKTEESTETEFKKAFNKTSKYLKSLI